MAENATTEEYQLDLLASPLISMKRDTRHGTRKADSREWVSKWLDWRIVWATVAFTVLLIVAIICLCIASHRNHGIASISNDSEVIFSYSIGIGLAWTTVPVLIFLGYAFVVQAIVTAAAVRQPYIELREEGENDRFGAALEKSILLDYQSYWTPFAWLPALKYNHYPLALGFFALMLLNVFVTSLAAHLFYATSVRLTDSIDVTMSQTFDGSALSGNAPMTPVIGVVSSLAFGGRPIPWTSETQAFVPFSSSTSAQELGKGVLQNITVATSALSVEMDCQILGPSDFELLPGNGGFFFSIRDRGCNQSDVIYTPPIGDFYTYSIFLKSNNQCSYESGYTRVYTIAAANSRGANPTWTDAVAVSCIPSYYNTTGHLTVSVDASRTQNYVIEDFVPEDKGRMSGYPNFGVEFAGQVVQPVFIDSSAVLLSNFFGTVLFEYTKNYFPNDFLSGPALLNATQTLYTAAFAVMSRLYLLQPGDARTVQASIQTEETRVIVVLPVAGTILGILVVVLGMIIWLYLYNGRHCSILREQPIALLGAAVLLRHSPLMDYVEEIDAEAWEGQVSKAFIRQEKQKDPRQGWGLLPWHQLDGAKIGLTARAREFGFFQPYSKAWI